MTDQAANFTGDIPDFYDRGLGPVIFTDYAADLARRVAASKPSRVLETAAGTGIVTRRLRDALPASSQLTATDLNAPMLEVSRGKFRQGESLAFKTADATALPFADSTFEAAACQFGVMFFPDKPKSYREIHRVLTPGGRYVFSVWDAQSKNPFARITHEVVTHFFPNDPPQFYQVPFGYCRIDPIKEALEDASFRDIGIDVVRLEKTIGDLALFARGLIFGNPIVEQIRTRGTVEPERVVERLLTELGSEFGTAQPNMPLQAIVFEAARP